MKHAIPCYQDIQDLSGRIPPDEPVFLLRAQDETAANVVRFWASLQPPGPLKSQALLHADQMDAWPKKMAADFSEDL